MASKTTNYNLDMPGYDEIADIDVINGNMDKIDVQMKKNADSAQQSKDIVSDEYSATNTYAVGDYCIHENILYKCKTAITTGEEFDSNKWVQTTCGTEFKELNSNLEAQGLLNKFDNQYKDGFYETDGKFYVNPQWKSTKNAMGVSSGDILSVNFIGTPTYARVVFFDDDNTFVSSTSFDKNIKAKVTTPSGATKYFISFFPNTVTVDSIYINNAIDELKNDLVSKDTITATTTANGNVVGIPNDRKILSCKCTNGAYLCIPFNTSNYSLIKVLSDGMTVISNVSVSIEYYYTRV